MNNIRSLVKSKPLLPDSKLVFSLSARNAWNTTHRDRPNVKDRYKRVSTVNYRREVFYPVNHKGEFEYTVAPLKYRNLAGRDPISGENRKNFKY